MYLLNLVPSKSVPKTPVELWSGRNPSMIHLHIWGCPAYKLKGKFDKLQSKTEVVFFVGYPEELLEVYSIVIRIIKCLLAQMPNSWKMTI